MHRILIAAAAALALGSAASAAERSTPQRDLSRARALLSQVEDGGTRVEMENLIHDADAALRDRNPEFARARLDRALDLAERRIVLERARNQVGSN